MRTLPGQELRDSDYAQLLKRVDSLLWELVYKPVVDLVRPTLPRVLRPDLAPRALRDATPEELRNASDSEGLNALRKGLQSGAVQLIPDHTGQAALFAVVKPDRRISDGLKSFGCVRNKTTGLWACPYANVPAWVRFESAGYTAKARATHEQVLRLLDDLEPKVDRAIHADALLPAAKHATGEIEAGWKTSARALQVIPNLSARGQQALTEGFAANAKIPIVRLAKEMITELRQQVDENAMRGFRSEALAQRIRDQYALSKPRADLIARQETSNFMAAYRAARALDAGLTKYAWAIVGDARTRPGHRELPGIDIGHGIGIFTYKEKAPAQFMSNGQRNNPGSDFRCRCNDLPVIE